MTSPLPFDRGPHRERKRRAARARAVSPVTSTDLVPAVQIQVLQHLAQLGDLSKAAALSGTTMSAVRQRAKDDEEFATALEGAWADYRDAVLIPAAAKRAVEGVWEPAYYRGGPARDHVGGPECRAGTCACPPGGKRNYSDALLLRLLEVLDPRFRPHKVIESSQPIVGQRDLDALSPEARAKLESFLAQCELDGARPADVEPQSDQPIAPDPDEHHHDDDLEPPAA